jgi:hypothetical protein
MKIVALLAVLFVCCGGTSVFADRLTGELAGSYGFYGDKCDDKGNGIGCVMTFEIKGAAAKALYDRITWKPQPDACTDGLVKDSRNGMRCYKVKGEYSCDFGYSFLQQQMTHSDVTC